VELSRASKLDEAEDGRIRVLGVKYTTSRALASRAVQIAAARLGKPADDALGRLVPLVSRPQLVREFAGTDASRSRRLAGSDLTAGEVEFAVTHELARDLVDVLLRRTRVANAGHPGAELVQAVAGEMAARLGWTEAEAAREVERFERDGHFGSVRAGR
jgi:glycerol-3-phosphate dehydrogenase